jgi:hypothetical protein
MDSLPQLNLTAGDLAHFAVLRIPEGLLALAGIERVDDAAARSKFGIQFDGNLDGIVFPYTSNGARVTARLRRDNCEVDAAGKPASKYILAFGDARHAYLIPGSSDLIADKGIPILFVEAEKSVLAIWAWCQRTGRRVLPIGLGGCWAWRAKVGIKVTANGSRESEKGVLPELSFANDGRVCGILFDSNVGTNRKVRQARKALHEQLTKQGAKVLAIDLPIIAGVNGPDDFIGSQGDGAFGLVLDGKAPKQMPATPDARPAVTIRPGESFAATDEAERILLDHAVTLGIFQRAGELVHIVRIPKEQVKGALRVPAGSVVVEPVSRIVLQEIFDRLIRFEKLDKTGRPYSTDCTAKVCDTYLARTGSKRVPVLTGTIFAPILREDGTILDVPGFDQETGLYFISDDEWLPVPSAPTIDDAQEAVGALLAPFLEFPWRTPADMSVHVAAVATSIQRRLLSSAPLFAYSAPSQRTGKSLLAESLSIIANGRRVPATATSKDPDEFRKAITAALYQSLPAINLDNIDGVLASPFLSMALTQEIYSDRILGASRTLQLPTRVLWTCTGCNLTLKGDLIVRTLMCTIDSSLEHPEERKFKIPDLANHLLEYRPELVQAALTLLRAYHVAGRPPQDIPRWGGFDEWSDTIRSAIVWAGFEDPAKTRAGITENDPERESALTLLEALQVFHEPFTLQNVIASKDADLVEALKAIAYRKENVDSRALAWWFRKWRDRIVGGLRLVKAGEQHSAAQWRVEQIDPEREVTR